MKNKKVDIVKEEWDFLIVLDACRYDYFSKMYDKFLTGRLEKRLSPGCSTPEWLQKTFVDYYNMISSIFQAIHTSIPE